MAFAFENLKVYQRALDFAVTVIEIIDEMDTPRKHYRLIEQLESSCTSVALNISEGKGFFPKKSSSSSCILLGDLFMKLSRCYKYLGKRIGYGRLPTIHYTLKPKR